MRHEESFEAPAPVSTQQLPSDQAGQRRGSGLDETPASHIPRHSPNVKPASWKLKTRRRRELEAILRKSKT